MKIVKLEDLNVGDVILVPHDTVDDTSMIVTVESINEDDNSISIDESDGEYYPDGDVVLLSTTGRAAVLSPKYKTGIVFTTKNENDENDS